ncbi:MULTISPECIES: flagellar biosynthesis protein FliQ [unclassified Bordetella]|uniref:flagellar biosynthesis protein FliQ n=1 Tax=unclassified Bordetella TaxID=2630031 RepID=UPI00132A322B|nr:MULTISPECIES: flagellar biosynthesis protein FliQ [unclassified Bordetella]MVW69964.1 flagellar biosynthesis protein FliQ [Bordetella sp. 15P40C-2]MVW78178.1 flagellar biosynthesis protein FliQ [Bordetella sp. 02P26C-1]
MNSATVMSMTYEAMLLALSMAGPLLLTTLAVGLIVSIFQAATQINEMTLSFIPKLLAVGIVLVLTGPWLIGLMVDYIEALFISIPKMVA